MRPGVYRVEFCYWPDYCEEFVIENAIDDVLHVSANNAEEAIDKAKKYIFETFDWDDEYDEHGELLPDGKTVHRNVTHVEIEAVSFVSSVDLS